MPAIQCVVSGQGRVFTAIAALPRFDEEVVLRFDTPDALAAEILWLGQEYGDTPWLEPVAFPLPQRTESWWCSIFFPPRTVTISEDEKGQFMKRWEALIAHHGLVRTH